MDPEAHVNNASYWLPRFQANIPVNLYINGKQVPPIEAQGEIIGFSSTCLQIRCESKIPIPSRGTIRFSLGKSDKEITLSVDFVQRVELTKSLWSWGSASKYEMRAALQGNSGEVESQFKHYINELIFSRSPMGLESDPEMRQAWG